MIDNKEKVSPEKSALEKIREAERLSHIAQYESTELFQEGSWLQKPIKTITDLYPYFDNYSEINILDLGCGVGRSCIPFVYHFRDKCRAEAVDILDVAINKLMENCRKYGLEKNINGVLIPLEDYTIQEDAFDLIIAVSVLEHAESEAVFVSKLKEMKRGLKDNGIVCLIINSQMTEFDQNAGCCREPQFEVNLKTDEMQRYLHRIFSGFDIRKETVKQYKYQIPRENGPVELATQVVTFVAVKQIERIKRGRDGEEI